MRVGISGIRETAIVCATKNNNNNEKNECVYMNRDDKFSKLVRQRFDETCTRRNKLVYYLKKKIKKKTL